MLRFLLIFTVVCLGLFAFEVSKPGETWVVTPFTDVLASFSTWLIKLFDASSNLLLRALRIEPVHDVEHSATARDLQHIVAESRQTGELPADDDLVVYEVKQGLTPELAAGTGLEAGPSFHFALNNTILLDNRIPPRGFTRAAFRTTPPWSADTSRSTSKVPPAR